MTFILCLFLLISLGQIKANIFLGSLNHFEFVHPLGGLRTL